MNDTKNKKLKVIVIVAVLMLTGLVAVNVVASYISVKKNVELSIASQSVRVAKQTADSIDVEQYKRFLEHRTRDKDFWELTSYLNDTREKTGALYLYTFEIKDPKQAYSLIVTGFEDDVQYDIGIPCTIPEGQLRQALNGNTYFTSVIEDKRYGTYISAGAPIKDTDGTIIGYVGIDMDVQVLKEIERKVFQHNAASFLFSIVFVIILLMAFYSLQKWYGKELNKEVGDTEATYQEELHSLFDALRSIRHDYLNHIQVLHGLLKIGKYEMAKEYMDSLVKEARVFDAVPMEVDHPALLVLFQAKKVLGQTNKVSVELDIDKDPFEKMKTTDLIKVLSNLIDNAIEAALQMEEGHRTVDISCKRKPSHYVFKVENSGPVIPKAIQEEIFKSGYSTKAEKAGKIRGQGLFIVQETVAKYKGTISLHSSDGKTSFEIWIPIDGQL